MRKFLPAVVMGIVVVVVLAGLFALRPSRPVSPGGGIAQASANRIVIISPHNEGIQQEFKRAFEGWHQRTCGFPCKVEWQDHGGTSDAVRFIKSEFTRSPAGIGVDIFWGGGTEPYLQFKALGVLDPVQLPAGIMSALPATIGGVPVYDPDQTWYGTALSGFGIIYNKKRLAELRLPEPKTWTDLAAPEFVGQVGAADPRASGTAQTLLEVILQAYGWDRGFETLARISANVKNFSRGANDVPKQVSLGEVAAGLAIDFYAWTQIRQDGKDKIGFVLPEGLTPLTPDGIGVLKGAPHREAAQRFVQFVMSPEGQRLWVLPKGYPEGPSQYELLRIPVLPEAYQKYAGVTNVLFDPSKARAGYRYDSAKAAARRDALKDLYGAFFIDLSPELTAAWKAVIRRGMKPDDVAQLCTPPVSEQQLIALSKNEWSKPDARNLKLTEWTNLARERYKAAQQQDAR